MGTQAVELYSRIPPEFIKEITHVYILNACSHAGLVDEARVIFNNIKEKSEKIYTTMVTEHNILLFMFIILIENLLK